MQNDEDILNVTEEEQVANRREQIAEIFGFDDNATDRKEQDAN